MILAKNILVIDDDQVIRDLLGEFLIKYGYTVTLLPHGKELQQTLADQNFDLIILDIVMPGDDGFALCRMVRKDLNIPIVMLTGINDETDRIIGLELGADDYITKPFNPRELLARVKAVLRRSQYVEEEAIEANQQNKNKTKLLFAGWELDTAARRLLNPECSEVTLSAGEYGLLVILLEHPQRVISRDMLMDLTKHRVADSFDRSIDVQISRLRQKLNDDPKQPQFIKTVRNGGYLFSQSVTKSS